jgi:hypothetical protein
MPLVMATGLLVIFSQNLDRRSCVTKILDEYKVSTSSKFMLYCKLAMKEIVIKCLYLRERTHQDLHSFFRYYAHRRAQLKIPAKDVGRSYL